MAVLTVQDVTLGGVAPAFSAASAGGDTFPYDAEAIVVVKNGSAAAITVTVTTPGTLASGDAYPDKVISVPAGGERWFRVVADYRDPTTGNVALAYSAVTSVTVAVVHG